LWWGRFGGRWSEGKGWEEVWERRSGGKRLEVRVWRDWR